MGNCRKCLVLVLVFGLVGRWVLWLQSWLWVLGIGWLYKAGMVVVDMVVGLVVVGREAGRVVGMVAGRWVGMTVGNEV